MLYSFFDGGVNVRWKISLNLCWYNIYENMFGKLFSALIRYNYLEPKQEKRILQKGFMNN